MSTPLLLSHIRHQVSLPEAEGKIVLDAFFSKNLVKKEILLSGGEVSHHMRFIEKGCLRSYHLDEKGQEHILQFGIEGWWVNDLYSYLTRTPATTFIQAVEPATIRQIHRDRLEQLFKEVPVMERFFRLKMQNAYVATQRRTLQTMSRTAEERYLEFLRRYRAIEQRVPQYMVASYLGITPEHLSTIRKKQ